MDFVRSYFGTNEPLNSGLLSADLEKSVGKKCLSDHRFICTEVNSYKIHTLMVINGYEYLVVFQYKHVQFREISIQAIFHSSQNETMFDLL